MKKIIVFGLSALLLLSALAGCVKTGEDSGQTVSGEGTALTEQQKATLNFGGETITFAYPPSYDMVYNESNGDPFLKRRADRMVELGEKYNCTIEQIEGRGTYWDLMANTIAAGAPLGHVVVTQENYLFNWFKAGAAANLVNAMAETGIDFTDSRYSQVVRKKTRFDGGQYGFCDVPLNPTGALWVVNLSLFEREQIGDVYEMQANKEWTWDKVEEIAKKTTKRNADGTVSQWGLSCYQCTVLFGSLITSNGGNLDYYDDNGDPCIGLRDPEVMEAMETFYRWCVVDRIANVNDGSKMWTELIEEFTQGNTAITCSANKLLQIAEEAKMEDRIGVVYPPIGPRAGGEYINQAGGGQFYFIPSTYEDMAAKLLLLVDDIYAPYEDASHDDLVMEKYAKRIGNTEQSMMTYINMTKDSMRTSYNNGTAITHLDWTSPSITNLCGDIMRGEKLPGEAAETYASLFLKNMQDAMDGHKLNINAP